VAYFRTNGQSDPAEENVGSTPYEEDGFDELDQKTKFELTPEEEEEERQHRIRLAYGAGNTFALALGVVVILVMITLLLSMIRFVQTDIIRNFTLFSIRF